MPNDDLARWGEPPADADEFALAEAMTEEARPIHLRGAAPLLEVNEWMRQLVHTILDQSDLLAHFPPQQVGWLRLSASRALPGGNYQALASTHAVPMSLRDLRRVPDDPDRVTLRTGDRVRVEVVCDRAGYLAVLNVGPSGNVHLLHPEQAVRAGETRHLFDVEMIPPTGRERLYAIWTRHAATSTQLADLVRPGVQLRDMVRVHDALSRLPEEDWHAVLLELEHQ